MNNSKELKESRDLELVKRYAEHVEECKSLNFPYLGFEEFCEQLKKEGL